MIAGIISIVISVLFGIGLIGFVVVLFKYWFGEFFQKKENRA